MKISSSFDQSLKRFMPSLPPLLPRFTHLASQAPALVLTVLSVCVKLLVTGVVVTGGLEPNPAWALGSTRPLQDLPYEETPQETLASSLPMQPLDTPRANSTNTSMLPSDTPRFSVHLQKNAFVSRDYRLGPNDVLAIQFPLVPEMTIDTIRVPSDGKLQLALIGSIQAAGLTLDEFHNALKLRYSEYLVNPQVTVALTEAKPFIVQVTGGVLRPGVFELNSKTNQQSFVAGLNTTDIGASRRTPLLSNVLIAAGGVVYDADVEHVEIYNTLSGERFQINLLDLLAGDAQQDIYLSAGDVVKVPRLASPLAVSPERYKSFANATFAQNSIPVRVYGYVNTPGLVQLDTAQSINLMSAITQAGGYQSASAYAPRKVYISRLDEQNKLVTMAVDPKVEDTILMPNDIVYVPQKVIPRAGLFFDFLSRIVAPASLAAGGYNNWALVFDPSRFGANN
jgi:protein involved in polysaccharide export with SLBB domain